MKTITRSHGGGIYARLTAWLLAFLFLITPFAPVFAQEIIEQPVVSEPVIQAPQPEVSEPVVSEPTPEITENPSPTDPTTDTPASTDKPTEEATPEEEAANSKPKPIDGELIDPAPESMMAQPGPELNFASSSIKSGLPEVDKASGALVLNYPLTVPPGRNGMQPDLALIYNSQGGEDGKIFGDKWSINIPYIERINRKGTDKLYTEDLFTSSIDGELVDLGSGVFRPKFQNSEFIKYEYASSAWIATDKKGTKYKFGTTASSRLDNPSDSTKIYRWMIDDLRDLNKNYIKYTYYKDQGEIYPSTVVYTGNDLTDGIFEVSFTQTARTNPVISAKPGFTIKAAYYISQIDAKINGTWARRYVLAYTTTDNGQSLLLNTITESGQDESSTTVSLPAQDFDYQIATTSGNAWPQDTNWSAPVDTEQGVIIADANGDGLDDFIQSYYTGSTELKKTWLNTGSGGWTLSSNFVPPVIFTDGSNDEGVRALDVNGDGLVDLVRKKANVTGTTYLNNGTGWTSSTNWISPANFAGTNEPETKIGDFNGDGLPDLVVSNTSVYLNNGTTGWTSISWTIPVDVKNGIITMDVNGDGLDDLVQAVVLNSQNVKNTWLNNGAGWSSTTDFVSPVIFWDPSDTIKDKGVRALDVNGDGLTDLVQRTGGTGGTTASWLNNGTGWNATTSIWHVPLDFALTQSGSDTGTRMGDFNGDGKIDFVKRLNGSTSLYLHTKSKADLLSKVTYPRGGTTDITYQNSPQYMSGSTQLNPSLPMSLVTVKTLTNDDGANLDSTFTFTYEGGKYYYNTAHDRKFAGFSKITKVDAAGNKVKTFYHQGDSTNSSQGEFSDHVSKIGKIYRVEITDSSDNIYAKKVSKWENYDLGSGRNFVKLTRTTELTYDGDSDHKDKSSTYTYDDANGNLTQQVDWGEVTGSDDGSYTDTGTDKFTTDITYASNTTYNILGLPRQETVTDQSSNKVRESKYYYDVQTHGSVNVGNLTKEEKWKTSTTYIDYEKTYNTTYGIVTSEKDPRDKTTSYTYDSYNLYPATVTNPLSQATSYTYDYSIGKPKQVTDPNTRVFQTVYDGLDRVTEEKQPDLTTPTTLVTKTAYTYTSQTIGNKIQKTDYLDGTTTVDTLTYTDGFDRPIQVRTEHEDTNTFSVTDTIYNTIEQINKESLPYSSTGTSKTSATTTAALLITYSYDPMYRVTTTVNAVGTVTNAYDDWKQAITDARSKNKNLYKDAYGNLIKVEEFNSASTYTTNYEYNGNNNLTKITDALSNVRNFTYDGLGRRLTAQDLHASADTSFGTWTYTYDDSGNLTSVTDPKSQQIDYTYDDINRRLTENYTGQAGTEITYTYDSGTDGTGRLTSVTATGANTSYLYNPHGKVKRETKTINATNYQTDYTLDRQGNVLTITNPDSSEVKYTYNTAGQLETVQRKESTDGSYINLVTDLDYGPHGKLTSQTNVNGTTETNTYDSTKLYRLTRKQVGSGGGGTQTATFYTGAGDGEIYKMDATWSGARGATSGTASYTNSWSISGSGKTGGDDFMIYRSFLPFNTASLPDDASISAVRLKVFVYYKPNGDNDGDDWMTVIQTSQASTSSLTGTDYDDVGATEGVDTSERKDITSITNDSYLTFNLNATGKSWVSVSGYTKLGLREGHDMLNSAYAGATDTFNRINYRSSEYTDTANDPILEVDYTSASSTNTFQDISYTYDANGNITQIVDASNTNSSKTVDYVYDDLNRLTSATATNVASGQSTYTKTYTYNAIGNITAGDAGNYTYAGDQGSSKANPHAVTSTSTGTKTYTYDDNGNLLTVTGGLSNTWDYSNRLTQAVLGGVTSTYDYDHNGERVKLANGTTTTYYPSKFYNIEGSNRVKHIYAGDRVIATVTGTGASAAVYTVHTDQINSSNVVTNSSGTQEELMDYFPFGNIRLDQKAASFGEQRKFAGTEYDADTQLNYMTARYYKSDLGRFISQDPVFLTAGGEHIERWLTDPQIHNSYNYSRNNPLVYIDKDGEFPILAALIVGAAIGGLTSYFGQPKIANAPMQGQTTYRSPSDARIAANTALGIYLGELTFGAAAVEYNAATVYNQQLANEIQTGSSQSAVLSAPKVGMPNIQANKAKGDAFEKQTLTEMRAILPGTQPQITLKTNSGIKVRVDMVAPLGNGKYCLVECKSSATASLTSNQTKAFPEIQQTGAIIQGAGKPGLQGGTLIPPTQVQIIRPRR